MSKLNGLIFSGTFILVLYTVSDIAAVSEKTKMRQQNHAPVVKITSPAVNNVFNAGDQVNYTIVVSDKEDGESKYDEINTKQVLLEVKHIKDKTQLASAPVKAVRNDPPGLLALRTSNCFNCHNFNSKLIGPSFNDINKRYKPAAANLALLEKRIREGSSGVWGKASMPRHPELSETEIRKMVKWIVENASRPDVDYYVGTVGSFRMPVSAGISKDAGCLLKASYTDHGIGGNSSQRLTSQDVIVLRLR